MQPLNAARLYVQTVASNSPARLALLAFLSVIAVFTLLLALPISSANNEFTALHDALFTAVSAVCVTGLTVVSTADHWSFWGQVFISLGVFIGGLGILTIAALLSLAVSKKLGVRGKLMAQSSMSTTASGTLGEVRSLLKIVITTSVIIQLALMLVLTPRFVVLGESVPTALWHGMFYAISAFNNAGFTPHSNGLVPYEMDLYILIPLMVGVFIGSLGFPVILVLLQFKGVFSKWNLHTKITIIGSFALVVIGAMGWGLLEWNNVRTIGGMATGDKIVHAIFASIMTRSGGFNLVDQAYMETNTMLATDALMFVGGGSASTAGGIKITTLAVLFLAIFAEARGERDVKAFGRTIPEGTLRVAISVVVLGATLVATACGLIMMLTPASLDRVLFESISAFATVGLSTNLSAELPPAGKYILAALMFAGRIGTITLASALSLKQRDQLYRYPEERPIIG
ncbi:TrkH family potassium uptake protein [Neomicrococcus aestuarii]|uniref:Potassium transporter Trk n=1 Tax=Neomicrococcus aestuarii TaxID=556325 RepID=A0A1L2ZRW3_9MICC|nr:potassium transporter TrkG [Neomicrococcus aestuarii]APF41926.1 potassium transporter Trk [Neomicrococcus aestuarii]